MKKNTIFFPNLDGLRFFCFLSVFFFHSFFTESEQIKSSGLYHFIKKGLVANGNLGVNFFFVLSGFLITYLLLEEKKRTGSIGIRNFYTRRMLRIWPLYYFCVFFGFIVFPFLKSRFGGIPNETASPAYYLLFLNNFDFIRKGLPDSSVLGVLWSVAIEEQFYLVWPLLLALVPERFYKWLFLLIIFASVVFRALHYGDYMIIEYHSLSVISDMAVGGLAAYLVFTRPGIGSRIENTGKWTILLLYTITGILFFTRQFIFTGPMLVACERVVLSILFIFIILEQNYAGRSFFKLGKYRLVSKLGTITYGLYCLHFIGILITLTLTKRFIPEGFFKVLLADTFISLGIAIVIAWISYTYFEKPFLKLKKRFS